MTRAQQAAAHIRAELQGKRVLEAACGCGEFSLAALSYAREVCCIDLEEGRLLPAAKADPRLRFRLMDAGTMDFAAGSFDAAVLYNAVGHLTRVLENAVEECRRVVRSGGPVFVISSVKMDKMVIDEQLLPLLQKKGIGCLREAEGPFAYLRLEAGPRE